MADTGPLNLTNAQNGSCPTGAAGGARQVNRVSDPAAKNGAAHVSPTWHDCPADSAAQFGATEYAATRVDATASARQVTGAHTKRGGVSLPLTQRMGPDMIPAGQRTAYPVAQVGAHVVPDGSTPPWPHVAEFVTMGSWHIGGVIVSVRVRVRVRVTARDTVMVVHAHVRGVSTPDRQNRVGTPTPARPRVTRPDEHDGRHERPLASIPPEQVSALVTLGSAHGLGAQENVTGVSLPVTHASVATDGEYPARHCAAHVSPEPMTPPEPQEAPLGTTGSVQLLGAQEKLIGERAPATHISGDPPPTSANPGAHDGAHVPVCIKLPPAPQEVELCTMGSAHASGEHAGGRPAHAPSPPHT